MLIKWDDTLSVGVEIFDKEHQKLINLINSLHDAMKDGKAREVLSDILCELLKYTETHFKHEEKIMEKYNYPGIVYQRIEHAMFVDKIADAKKRFDEGNFMLSVELIRFLGSWLNNHIKKTDKEYDEFFSDKIMV